MNIVACVKHVALLGEDIEFLDDGRVDPDFVEFDVNEWDACAVEEALQIRDTIPGSQVTVVTVGGEPATDALIRCLAMGADAAIRVAVDDDWSCMDPITTARLLALAIAPLQPHLVLTGLQSSDSAQGSTGTALSELLQLACVVGVTEIDRTGFPASSIVTRELAGGFHDVLEVSLPALFAVQTGINQPRYVTMRALRDVQQFPIDIIDATLPAAPGFQLVTTTIPAQAEGVQLIEGSAHEIALAIATIVKERSA